MNAQWARNCVLLTTIFIFSAQIFMPATSTVDSTIAAIATAAQGAAQLRNDRGSYMTNYIKYHFAPAATRLSNVCNMTANTFSGNQADQGVILGVSNNTGTTFIIQQSGQNIAQLTPGWNGDVVLNLASLSSSSSTASSLPSFTFIPSTGDATSKLVVRVMTGQQLFEHIANEQTKESTSAATVTFLKNGVNPLPGAGEVAAIASDFYLVVENESLTSGQSLSAAAKRIQVLNLANITNMYTVSLSISSMGLASINNQVSDQSSLSSTYSIAIKSVHVLNEVNGHTVPLLMMPRSVYLAESAVNTLYAPYVQAYAKSVGAKYAGTDPVYYDLSILYSHEPFEYLRLLKYFDLYLSLLAVVDQNGAMPSGQIIGSYILTDVYGAYAQDVSPDLSWVSCNSSGFDTTDNDQILFACATAQDAEPGVPLQLVTNWLEQSLQVLNPIPTKFHPSSRTTPGFPISHPSSAMMLALTISAGQYYGCINVHANNADSMIGGAVLNTGTPTNVTPGQSYGNVGSMPSGWWMLSEEDLVMGIKVVPVFYKAGTCVPFLSQQEYQLVNSTNQSALYYYSYSSVTGESLGMLPALNTSGVGVATYSAVSDNAWWGQCNQGQIVSYQAANYATFGTAKVGDTNLVYQGASYVDYPGYSYFAALPSNFGYLYTVRNKFANMLPLRDLIQKHWTVQNAVSGVGAISVPLTDIELTQKNASNGIVIQVTKISAQNYELVLFDAQNNVLGFQQIHAPENASQLVACRISGQGVLMSQSRPLRLPQATGYFKLSHVPGAGLQLVPTVAPVSVSKAPIIAAKKASAVVPNSAVSKKTVDSNNALEVQRLTAENIKLRGENRKLRKELAAANNA